MTLATTPTPAAPEQAGRGRFIAEVIANSHPCREHNKLTLRMERFPPSQPGQFVQVRCRDVDDAPLGETQEVVIPWPVDSRGGLPVTVHQPDLVRPTPIIRRPFSLAGRRSTPRGEEIELINRDIGPGTHWLHELKPGAKVDILGPLGNAFTLPEPDELALLVGGGVGIPPMLYLAQGIAELNAHVAERERRSAVAFCGTLSVDLLPLHITEETTDTSAGRALAKAAMNIAEFAAFGTPAVISTDDGSYGYHGRVTGALVHFLDHAVPKELSPFIYTCGPEPMMKAVAGIALERGIRCEVAVERAMACGMGTCQSCVIRQSADTERGWRYRLACTDGPIFDAATLLW